MPIYEKLCKACTEEFEVMCSIDTKDDQKCPQCGSMDVIGLLSAPVVKFVGEGFYENDSKKSEREAVKKRFEGAKYKPSSDS